MAPHESGSGDSDDDDNNDNNVRSGGQKVLVQPVEWHLLGWDPSSQTTPIQYNKNQDKNNNNNALLVMSAA